MSQKFFIVCAGFADGKPCSVVGHYLKSYDPDIGYGDETKTGLAIWTDEITKAKAYANYAAAFAEWNQQSKRVPYRPDGKPNKPLTAFNVEVVAWPRTKEG